MKPMSDKSMSHILHDSLRVGLLLCAPAAVAWASGLPFIFPSLGPSAFSLVVESEGHDTARRVLGGHLLGVVSGLVAYHLIAPGLTLTALPASLSPPLLRLAASGITSVVLATAGMMAANARHAPACATTLIVSLGLMTTPRDALCIMFAVSLMYGAHRLLDYYTPE
ncbi:MAG TPA: HPP family protein [Desulfuromonadaceae bacterium]